MMRLGLRVALALLTAASLVAHRSTGQPTDTAHKYALLVGVDDYAEADYDTLEAPANDVALIEDLLITQYGFSKDRIKKLIGSEAKQAAIRAAVRTHLIDAAKVNRNAMVVLYFSGHGSQSWDTNGDEGDGLDETLVPYDADPRGERDIVDDEVQAWFQELIAYTNNIAFVFDSCHSGTATKGFEPGTVAKEIPIERRKIPREPPPAVSAAPVRPKDLDSGILDRNDKYTALSASLASERAYETLLPDVAGQRKKYSVFTYYLEKALRERPTWTYAEAVETAAANASRRWSQHPQAEGSIHRPSFGIAADAEDPYIRIRDIPTDHTLTIGAGAIHAVREGTLVAVYAPGTKKLSGGAGRLATGTVVGNPGPTTSTVDLGARPAAPIPRDARVAVMTPAFGAPIRVTTSIRSDRAAPMSAAERAFRAAVAKELKTTAPLITVVETPEDGSGGGWDLAIVDGGTEKGTFGVFENGSRSPLFGRLEPIADANAVASIIDVIGRHARAANLRALTNKTSELNGLVTLEPVKVTVVTDPTGQLRKVGEEVDASARTGIVRYPIGEYVRFKVTNNSRQLISAVVLVVGSSGETQFLTPRGIAEEVKPRADLPTDVFRIEGPAGLETYKAIVYARPDQHEPIDFNILGQKGLKERDLKDLSPLAWLVGQAVVGRSKDPGRVPQLTPLVWTAVTLDVIVVDKRQ
jgi:hypothetical protein